MKNILQRFLAPILAILLVISFTPPAYSDVNGEAHFKRYNRAAKQNAKKNQCGKKKKNCKNNTSVKLPEPHRFEAACCNKTIVLHIDGYKCDKNATTADGGCKICGGLGTSQCTFNPKNSNTVCGKCT